MVGVRTTQFRIRATQTLNAVAEFNRTQKIESDLNWILKATKTRGTGNEVENLSAEFGSKNTDVSRRPHVFSLVTYAEFDSARSYFFRLIIFA